MENDIGSEIPDLHCYKVTFFPKVFANSGIENSFYKKITKVTDKGL